MVMLWVKDHVHVCLSTYVLERICSHLKIQTCNEILMLISLGESTALYERYETIIKYYQAEITKQVSLSICSPICALVHKDE
jgi:hypothetical protein